MDLDHDIGKITGNLAILDPGPNTLTVLGTSGVHLPSGNTLQRPTFSNGIVRYNTDTGFVEVASNNSWVKIQNASGTGLPSSPGAGSLIVSTDTDWETTPASSVVLPLVGAVTMDMTGFPNRTDTSISYNSTTRTFSLTPTNTNAGVYHYGTWYPISSTLTKVWSNVDGGRFIYYNYNTQQLAEWFGAPQIKEGQILVAYIFWNVNDQHAVICGDERHSSQRDTQWHSTQHRDVGAVWRSGGSLTYTLDNDSAMTIGVSTPLAFADEDIEHQITHSTSPSANYQQNLSPAAWLPVLWLNGTTISETLPTSIFPFLSNSTRAVYNPVTGNSGALTTADNNKYINYWIIATNDIEYPVKLVVGRTLYDSVETTANETLQQYGLPFAEMAIMYRIVLHINDTYTNNSAKAVIKAVVNAYRSVTGGVTAVSATSHDVLSGRELDNQHPISAITNLQTTLDNKANISHTHTLSSLTDVSVTSPALGQTLYYNGTQWINYGQQGSVNGGGSAKRIWSNNIPASSGTTLLTPSTAIPTVTTGTQLWTVTLTPLSTTTTYVIQTSVSAAASQNGANLTLLLFRDGVYLGATVQIANSSNNSATLTINITDIPATTNPVTYQVRVATSTGTWYVNRRTSEITFGGMYNGWVIWEY